MLQFVNDTQNMYCDFIKFPDKLSFFSIQTYYGFIRTSLNRHLNVFELRMNEDLKTVIKGYSYLGIFF